MNIPSGFKKAILYDVPMGVSFNAITMKDYPHRELDSHILTEEEDILIISFDNSEWYVRPNSDKGFNMYSRYLFVDGTFDKCIEQARFLQNIINNESKV